MFVIVLSIFAHTPVPIRALSHAYPRLSALSPGHSRSLLDTPAPADGRILTGETMEKAAMDLKKTLAIIIIWLTKKTGKRSPNQVWACRVLAFQQGKINPLVYFLGIFLLSQGGDGPCNHFVKVASPSALRENVKVGHHYAIRRFGGSYYHHFIISSKYIGFDESNNRRSKSLIIDHYEKWISFRSNRNDQILRASTRDCNQAELENFLHCSQ